MIDFVRKQTNTGWLTSNRVKKKLGFTQRQRNGGAVRRAEGRSESRFRLLNELRSADTPAGLSRGRGAFGPHGSSPCTRPSVFSNAAHSGLLHDSLSRVGSFPPNTPRCHSATGYHMRCATVGSPSLSRPTQRPYQTWHFKGSSKSTGPTSQRKC